MLLCSQVLPGTNTSSSTPDLPVPNGTVLYHHLKATNAAGLAVFAVSDGVMVDARPPVRGRVFDGDDAALALYQHPDVTDPREQDLDQQPSLDTLVGRWWGFEALPAAPTPPRATPPRFLEPDAPVLEVGLATTNVPGPAPDVMPWVPCPGAPRAPCRNVSAAALGDVLRRCAPEVEQMRGGATPNCSCARDCTCGAAVAQYRSSCAYQRLPAGDSTRRLVDALHRHCGAPGAACAPWQANGTFAVGNLSLVHGQTYFVVVRATGRAGLETVVASDGVTPDVEPPEAGPVAVSTRVEDTGALVVDVSWHGWRDLELHHYAVCVRPPAATCSAYESLGGVEQYTTRLPPVDSPVVVDVCVRGVDGVRLHTDKCREVQHLPLAAPQASWVRNDVVEHRRYLPHLSACHWGPFTAVPGTGRVVQYEWGIGTSPNTTDTVALRPALYVREGRVPAVKARPGAPYYCTVRGTVQGGAAITASSPPFYVCPAVANASVVVAGATQTNRSHVCVAWAVPTEDPGADCVVQQQLAVGSRPYGVSARPFANVSGTAACVRVPLLDGHEYYATLRLGAASGATSAFVSPMVFVDGTPPEIDGLHLGAVGKGGTPSAFIRAEAALQVAWTIHEPHALRLRGTIVLFANGSAVANTTAAIDKQGHHKFGLALQPRTAYHCELRVRNAAGLERTRTSAAVSVDDTPPVWGSPVWDGDQHGADAVWQRHGRRLAATWLPASDPESGVVRYEVCFGTAPGPRCDVSNFSAPVAPGLHVHVVPGHQPALALGVTYYATVRAYNGAALYAESASDGVRLDVAPPVFSANASVRVAGGLNVTASCVLQVTWDAPSDLQSGVASYHLAVGFRPWTAGVLRYAAVGNGTTATLTLPGRMPAYPFYVTVRALDFAGRAAVRASRRMQYDGTPPLVTRVLVSATADRAAAFPRHQLPRVAAEGAHAFLDGCLDPESGVSSVEWWLRAATSPQNLTAAAPVRSWATGWPLLGLAGRVGAYRLVVRVRNGAGLARMYQAEVQVDGTPPELGGVWDGVGGGDVDAVPHGHPVGARWRGGADPESGVAKYEWTLREAASGTAGASVVPWQVVWGRAVERAVPLRVGRRYVSCVRATNHLGGATQTCTDGFTVVPSDGSENWVEGLEVSPNGTRWRLDWSALRDNRTDGAALQFNVSIGTALGRTDVLAPHAVGAVSTWTFEAAALAEGTRCWVMVAAPGGLRSAVRVVADSTPPEVASGPLTVTHPRTSAAYIMDRQVRLCWPKMFADPHSGLAFYDVQVVHDAVVAFAAAALVEHCADVAHGLASGAAVQVLVTAHNANGLRTTVTTALTVDVTPPVPPAAVYYGAKQRPLVAQASRAQFRVEWEAFVDPESGPVRVTACLGAAPSACDVAQAELGPAAVAVHWTDLPAFAGGALWLSLEACNGAGLCASWAPHPPLLIDEEPPQVSVAVPGPALCPGPEFPCDTVWLRLDAGLRVELVVEDAGSGVATCWWGVGHVPSGEHVLPFAPAVQGEGRRSVRASVEAALQALPEWAPLWVTVHCLDRAALRTTAAVPIAVVGAAPDAREAAARVAPAVVRGTGAAVAVSWSGFGVPKPALVTYAVALGSRPGGTEYLPWAEAAGPTALLRPVGLPEGPAWVTVRAQYPTGHNSTVTRELIVDNSPPSPGPIARYPRGPSAAADCVRNGTALDVEWSGFVDTVSAVVSYDWALVATNRVNATGNGTGADQSTATPVWHSVGRRTYASVDLEGEDPGAYAIWVRATDAAGNAAQASLPLYIDASAPRVRAAGVRSVSRRRTVPSLTEFLVEWQPAEDPECVVVDYLVAVGLAEDSTSALPYTSVGTSSPVRVQNATLRHGRSYTLTLVAVNAAGLSARTYATFAVDATPPAPGAVYLRDDAVCQPPGGRTRTSAFVPTADSVTVCADGFADLESDTALALSLGARVGPDVTAVIPWTPVLPDALRPGGQGYVLNLSTWNATFAPQLPYEVRLRCTNAAGLTAVASTPPFHLDATAPGVSWFLYGRRAAQVRCALPGRGLRAEWALRDPESGVRSCAWAVGTAPGADDVMPLTGVAHADGVVAGAEAPVPLRAGQQYFVTLHGTNGAGLAVMHAVQAPLAVVACPAGDAACLKALKCL